MLAVQDSVHVQHVAFSHTHTHTHKHTHHGEGAGVEDRQQVGGYKSGAWQQLQCQSAGPSSEGRAPLHRVPDLSDLMCGEQNASPTKMTKTQERFNFPLPLLPSMIQQGVILIKGRKQQPVGLYCTYLKLRSLEHSLWREFPPLLKF